MQQPRLYAHDGSGVADDPVPAIERLCDDIAERIKQMAHQLEAQQKIIADLLRNAGARGLCKGPNCAQEILFITHANGARMPYNFDGTTHFATCVDRDLFHRGGKPNVR